MRRSAAIAIGLMLTAPGAWALGQPRAIRSATAQSIVNSKHDLSVHGQGPIRAVSETRICIFCHTPHNARPQTPLWNRHLPRTHYRIYESSTLDARVDQPTGSSKLCLSCHDGSLALGEVLSLPQTHPIVMTRRTIPPGPSDLTSDLSDDHPIGFRYDRALAGADPQLKSPDVISLDLPLGKHSELHCSTCHDPHDNSLGNFLRITDRRSALCLTCHQLRGWHWSVHARSTARVTGRLVDPRERLPYSTIIDNACSTCHKMHAAPARERLLRFRQEENNCLNCHDGGAARANILSVIRKSSSHPVDRYWSIHDPTEDPITMPPHVECDDCHNAHAVRPDQPSPARLTRGLLVPGQNLFVPGVDIAGARVMPAVFLYQICFRCHADNPLRTPTRIRRQVFQTNVRLEFQTINPSYHPVVGPRRNLDVVSLVGPLRQGSMISCLDCHNNDNARMAGGTGPNGPHGSIYAPLLIANYETQDFTVESADTFALCYRCHSRQSILGNESFSRHWQHVVSRRAPCSACHDPHGVSRAQGYTINHSNLINFDLSIVMPATAAADRSIEYRDTGRFEGSCTLTCHGKVHVRQTYRP